jgi:hypothetical protein
MPTNASSPTAPPEPSSTSEETDVTAVKGRRKKNMMDKAVVAALAQVQIAKEYLEILEFLMRGYQEGHSYQSREERVEFTALRSWGYERLTRAYSNLFMWNTVYVDSKLMRAAKKEAFEYFLDKDAGVMQYLNKYNYMSSCGGGEDEVKFRAEISKAKARASALERIRAKKERDEELNAELPEAF